MTLLCGAHQLLRSRSRGALLACLLFLGTGTSQRGLAADVEAAGVGELLLAALRHTTGFSDAELRIAAEDLLRLKPPSQRPLWQEHVQCGPERCAGEVAARVLVALAEARKLPLRGFEPYPDDPLYKLWVLSDQTEFHSWVTGRAVPNDAPLAALVPEGQPLATGRIQAAEFTRVAKLDMLKILGANPDARNFNIFGRCLEWDAPFYTVKALGESCMFHDVLTYADPEVPGREEGIKHFQYGTRTMSVNIMELPDWAPHDYGLVVCLFVLEHVPNPHRAMEGVARLMAVGGFLLVGAPFLDGVHGCPHDYFRYTPGGLKHVVEEAGLEVLRVFAPGDPASAAGEFLGMKSAYWSTEGLMEESDTHPINVFVLARKPWAGREGWRLRRRGRAPRPNRTRAWLAS